jgi:quercetin dioxygenase-like cupin family protein
MAFTLVPFASIDWEPGTHPLEKKKTLPRCGACLLQFEPGFADPSWCARSHVLYVVKGALGLEMDGHDAIVGPGECAVIDGGTRHRARNDGPETVVVFIVSDALADKVRR